MYAGSQQISIMWFEKRYIMNFYSAIQENYYFVKIFSVYYSHQSIERTVFLEH